MFDCIIVGAGVAGASAAYHLAKAGHKVLVLEKSLFPRYKACSGAVSPAIAPWFDFDFSPAISRKVEQISLTWQMGDAINLTLKSPEPMWMVDRSVFDQFLIQKAQSLGAEFQADTTVTGVQLQGNQWQVVTNQGNFAANYLIAADGAMGITSKLLKFKEKKTRRSVALEVSLEEGIPPQLAADGKTYFDFGSINNGYIWNFPKAGGRSLGITTFRGNDPKDLAKSLTTYAEKFGLTVKPGQIHESFSAIWEGNQNLHTDRALVIGEAAGLVDPLIGEGIRPGVLSGVRAAAAISAALGGDSQALAKYTQIIQQELGADMALGQKLAGLFYQFPKIAYKAGLKRPAIAQVMSMLLCGEITYTGIFDIAMKRLKGSMLPGMGG